MKEKLKIGITQGDINSISYEVILKNLAIPEMYEPHAVVLYGSPKVAAYHKKNLDLNVPMNTVVSAKDAAYGAAWTLTGAKQYWIAGADYKFVGVVDGSKTGVTAITPDAAGLPTLQMV